MVTTIDNPQACVVCGGDLHARMTTQLWQITQTTEYGNPDGSVLRTSRGSAVVCTVACAISWLEGHA